MWGWIGVLWRPAALAAATIGGLVLMAWWPAVFATLFGFVALTLFFTAMLYA